MHLRYIIFVSTKSVRAPKMNHLSLTGRFDREIKHDEQPFYVVHNNNNDDDNNLIRIVLSSVLFEIFLLDRYRLM